MTRSYAKVVDPKPIVRDEVRYQSHENYVEAVSVISGKRLWRTVLPGDVHQYPEDPSLEQDVQWHIVTNITVLESTVHATFYRGVYILDRKTGKILEILQIQGEEVVK